jgi:hypothetical protein
VISNNELTVRAAAIFETDDLDQAKAVADLATEHGLDVTMTIRLEIQPTADTEKEDPLWRNVWKFAYEADDFLAKVYGGQDQVA